jgi:Bacterial PH domain
MLNTKVGHFPPAKRFGLIVHGITILTLAAVSAWGFWNLARTQMGPMFVNYLLTGVLSFAPIPFLAYRAYALLRADYYIDRDSLAMLWGLRVEDIPLSDVEWVRPASDLTHPLSLPHLRLPGAILGTRRHADLGLVEFIASDSRNIILVATAKRVFAISPKDALVRFIWVSGLLLNIGLIIWVGLLIPSLGQISLGFSPFGTPLEPVPSIRLILLPLLSGLLFIAGWLAGLYFYRWDRQRMLSTVIWISSAFSALLFLVAVLFIVTTPV